jgi:acyl carrier protein
MDDGTSFEDSGMDSLAFLELIEELQNTSCLKIPDEDLEHIATIAGAIEYLNRRLQ